MSAISYPRSSGGDGASLTRLRAHLAHLRDDDDAAAIHAGLAIDQLRMLGQAGLAPADIATYARETLEAVVLARDNTGEDLQSFHQQAMEICSDNWVKAHPFEQTGFQRAADELAAAMRGDADSVQVKALSERAGSLSAFYHISALIGEDLSNSLWKDAVKLGDSEFRATHDATGRLRLLECAAAYSVNIYVTLYIRGVAEPLVIVAEAKGGKSDYGEVKGPAAMARMAAAAAHQGSAQSFFPISQKELRYAPSRAFYMVNSRAKGVEQDARREAGRAILSAYEGDRLVYLTARGTITDTGISQQREHLECN